MVDSVFFDLFLRSSLLRYYYYIALSEYAHNILNYHCIGVGCAERYHFFKKGIFSLRLFPLLYSHTVYDVRIIFSYAAQIQVILYLYSRIENVISRRGRFDNG